MSVHTGIAGPWHPDTHSPEKDSLLPYNDGYLTLIPGYIVLLPAAAVAVWLLRRGMDRRRTMWSLLALGHVTVVIALTLFPIPIGGQDFFARSVGMSGDNLMPFGTIVFQLQNLTFNTVRQLVGNMLALFPLGIYGPALWPALRDWRRLFAVALASAIAIELAQYAGSLIEGFSYRITDIDDAIMNTAGAVIAFAIWRWAKEARPAQVESLLAVVESLVVTPPNLTELSAEIEACRRCPRLVAWREEAASNPPRRYAGEGYWARPLPGWGDPAARVLLVGLAPAAHGGNRTGRLFTGDRSGDFLFASLYRTGFANQPNSTDAADGLAARDLYIAAVVRCAPPDNKPLPEERGNCLPYLARELSLLPELRVVVALGAYAWDGALRAFATMAGATAGATPRPAFGHAAEATVAADRYTLLGSYHPSQQNTFTGRLTPEMLDAVMLRARRLADLP